MVVATTLQVRSQQYQVRSRSIRILIVTFFASMCPIFQVLHRCSCPMYVPKYLTYRSVNFPPHFSAESCQISPKMTRIGVFTKCSERNTHVSSPHPSKSSMSVQFHRDVASPRRCLFEFSFYFQCFLYKPVFAFELFSSFRWHLAECPQAPDSRVPP